MKTSHIFYLSCFGGLAIAAVLLVQFFWVKAALDINESQFEQTVTIALRQVAEEITSGDKYRIQHQNPVKKVNANNYLVEVNSEIDAELLNFYLIQKFEYFDIDFDLEYGIYDCFSGEMVYCNHIKKGSTISDYSYSDLPRFEDMDYYFTVSFPKKPLLSMHKTPMWLATSIILMIVIAFFIYALYVVFAQRSLSRVQRDFINNMTHEFKTPISTISAIQQVLLRPENETKVDQRRNYLGIIGTEAARLNAQVEKVLSITKVENKNFILTKDQIHAHQILREVIYKNSNLAETQNVAVEGNFKAKDDLILADQVHFSNIAFNLVDNGIKYAGRGSKITLSTFNRGDNFILSVKDNGPGISQKEIKKIFDKFYRVHTGNVHDVKGFGIGLFYVKKVVEAHNWKIKVISEKNKGSDFIITIPQN